MDTSSRQHDLNQDDLSQNPERQVTSWLHPRVYALLIGFAGWFALAVWSFAGSGVTDYLLVIVSGFIFVVVALQLILSRVGHTNEAAPTSRPSLRNWITWISTPRRTGLAARKRHCKSCCRSRWRH